MYLKHLAALPLALLAATAAYAGPYDQFVGMSLKSATREVERQGFVYVRPLDISGNNESFLWQRRQTCVLFRTSNHTVVSVVERPSADCDPSSAIGGGSDHAGGSGHGGASGRSEVTELCKQAVIRRGYDRFDGINAEQQRGGKWSVTGRARGERGRVAFDCSIEGRSIRHLAVNPAGGGNGDSVVTCESEDRRYKRCEMDTRRGVRLVERISETRCVEGRNWGAKSGAVWVDKGCAARFQAAGGR